MQYLPLPTYPPRKYQRIQEDTNAPMTIDVAEVQYQKRAVNQAIMTSCEILGRRVRIRYQPEVWVKWGNKWSYRRLRQVVITASCPNSRQAEALTKVVAEVLKQLDGKFLAEE